MACARLLSFTMVSCSLFLLRLIKGEPRCGSKTEQLLARKRQRIRAKVKVLVGAADL